MNSPSTIGRPAVPWTVVTPERDVERRRRVGLHHAAELEAAALRRAVDDQPMALVVVGASPVLREIGRIDRRAEEDFADVVHRLRQRVRHAIVPQPVRALRQRHVQAVIVRVADRRVLAVVGVDRIRPAAVVVAGRHARRHVLVDRHQQVAALQVLIAGADRRALAELLLDLGARLLRLGVLQVAIHRRQVGQRDQRHGGGRMFGNTGAPACVGDRLTTYWRSASTSVVLPADSSALASARSGTRS